MIVRIAIWLLKLSLIAVLMAYEQVMSIPFLTLVAIILVIQNQSPIGRQALLIVSGLLLATVFVFPLGLGVLLVWLAAYGWKTAGQIMKSDVPRLVLISFVIALIVGGVSQVQWSMTSGLFLTVNLALSLVMMRFTTIASPKGGDDHL